MYEELNSETYAKAGTEYLFVTVLSAPFCALANPDLIKESIRVWKRLLWQVRAAEVKDNNGAPSNAPHAQLLVPVCLYAPPINFVMWSVVQGGATRARDVQLVPGTIMHTT